MQVAVAFAPTRQWTTTALSRGCALSCARVDSVVSFGYAFERQRIADRDRERPVAGGRRQIVRRIAFRGYAERSAGTASRSRASRRASWCHLGSRRTEDADKHFIRSRFRRLPSPRSERRPPPVPDTHTNLRASSKARRASAAFRLPALHGRVGPGVLLRATCSTSGRTSDGARRCPLRSAALATAETTPLRGYSGELTNFTPAGDRTPRSESQAGAGGHYRRPAHVDRGDDLLGVDASQVDRGHPQVAVAELALDDVERHAFAGQLDRVRVTELVRGEAPQRRRWPRAAGNRCARRRLSTLVRGSGHR